MDPFIDLDHVDVFTSGAVGEPGSRVFYLQARTTDRTVTVRCEKQQVATISSYLRRALADLPLPEGQPPKTVMKLQEPLDEEFVLGAVALEFSASGGQFALYLKEMTIPESVADDEEDDEDDDDIDDDVTSGARVRIGLTAAQAMAFCDHSDRIVAAGRPTCVYCDRPIDPDGHFCPRMN